MLEEKEDKEILELLRLKFSEKFFANFFASLEAEENTTGSLIKRGS